MSDRLLPMPNILTAPYWAAAQEGQLVIQRCPACVRYQFYPRGHCRYCLGGELEWVHASGRGRLYSFTIVRRTADPWFSSNTPYVLALVDLDEGVRITANIVVDDLSQLSCDLPVHITMRPITETISLPYAVPDPQR